MRANDSAVPEFDELPSDAKVAVWSGTEGDGSFDANRLATTTIFTTDAAAVILSKIEAGGEIKLAEPIEDGGAYDFNMYNVVSNVVGEGANTYTVTFSRTANDTIYTKILTLNTVTPAVSWESSTQQLALQQNGIDQIRALTQTATETDLVAGNRLVIDTADGPKGLPANAVAKAGDVEIHFVNEAGRGQIQSVVGENYTSRNNNVYSANRIVYVATQSAYQGLSARINNVIPNKILHFQCSRDTGRDFRIRVIFFTSAGVEISRVTSDETFVEVETPSNVSYMTVVFACCWAQSIESGTVVTFSDIAIYYTDLQTKKFEELEKRIKSTVVVEQNGVLSNVVDENNLATSNELYSASSFTLTTANTNAYQGVSIIVNQPIAGKVLLVSGSRSYGKDWTIRVRAFKNDGTNVDVVRVSASSTECEIPSNTKYVLVTFAASWGTSMPSGTIVTYSNIRIAYKEAVSLDAEIYGPGSYYYCANERVNFAVRNLYKSVRNDLLTKNNDDTGLGNAWKNAQSLAVFGNYLFDFESGAKCPVFNLDDNSVISCMQLPYDSHAANANFTTYKVANDDEFPLLMLCSSESSGGLRGVVSFLRISRNGNSFTCSEYKRVTVDDSKYYNYGGCSAWDNAGENLILYVNENGSYTTRTNNPTLIMRTRRIDLSNSSNETLSGSDISGIGRLPFMVLQGAKIENGKMAIGAQMRDNFYVSRCPALSSSSYNGILVIDIYSLAIVAIIPLAWPEPQGIDIVENSVYVSYRHSEATGSATAFWLKRFDF